MKITEDYSLWLESKLDLINELIEIESLIFNRIESVYNSLEELKKRELNDQEYHIFDVGYMYFSEQILGIENYIKIFGSVEELESQSVAYNYLMEVNDFYEDHDLEKSKDKFLSLIQEVEELLVNKKPLTDELYSSIQNIVEAYKDSQSIIEIFEDISDSLGV